MKRAFTLIELLVVVAIIGILAAIAVANFATARAKANLARVDGDFKALDTAIETYRLDNGEYPEDYMSGKGWDIRVLLAVLTSPVSYIGSIPWEDPFFSAQRARAGGGKPGDGITPPPIREPYYTYLNDGDHWSYPGVGRGRGTTRRDEYQWFPNWGQDERGRWVKGRQFRYLWYLNSFGPDQSPANWAYHQIYDPTNGLFSRGDIFWFGPFIGPGRTVGQ